MESLVKKGALGTILCTSGIITENDIAAALEEQQVTGCRFGEALVKLGIVKQEDIDWALSNQLDIPYVRLSEQIIDRGATQLITPDLARKYNLIPIIRSDDELHIALADPLNRAAVEEVELMTGCKVTVSIPIIRELREMLDLFYGPARKEVCFGFSSPAFSDGILEKINADTSGAQLLESLILYFFQNGLATISLRPAGGFVQVSGRQNRIFREIGRFPVASYPPFLSYLRKVGKINGYREPAAEGRLEFTYKGSDVALRLYMVKAAEGECITLRVYTDSPFPAGFDEIGLDHDTADSLRSLSSPGAGMILFSSWSRVVRNRFIDMFLDNGAHLNENVIVLGEGIGKGTRPYPRIPLPDGTPEDTAMLISAVLDHDPDLIALEEASDGRSFRAAWEAAMRGRLVAAGISCGSLESCLGYLLHSRFSNPSVSAGIRGIVAVAEVKTLCPNCGSRGTEDGDHARQSAPDPAVRFTGCEKCGYSGLGRRKYLLDVVPFDAGFRLAFATARESSELIRYLAESGYRGSGQELGDLLAAGQISCEEYDMVRAGLSFA